jgi:transposase
MAKKVINSVTTKGIGFAPILKSYFEKCAIQRIIEQHVPLDPRRKILSHGQASVAMITGILFQVLQLYRVCQFASETTVLETILPAITPEEYFDDRLADTLDALFDYGIGNLETRITQHMIDAFEIVSEACHNDTTSVSVYGDCDNNRTPDSIRITFGNSKKHRHDLKQLIWSLSVSSDSAFPLFQQAYNGNTADVDTYVEQWNNLIDLLGCNDFLYIADSKLITKETMAHIHDNEGFFVAPAPMYASYKEVFFLALDEHTSEELIPYKEQINRGFEVPLTITHKGKDYTFRMIIVYDHGLFARKQNTLDRRIKKTTAAFDELKPKLNTYNLKTKAAIEQACDSIIKKYHTEAFFQYSITNDPITSYKNKKRGRPAKNKPPETIAVNSDQFKVALYFDDDAFEQALYRCGYYPVITNKASEDFTVEDAMMAHKNQYKPEHNYRRAKSRYRIEPIYLHTPERIQALLFLFKIALQIIVLIERTARNNINERNKGLDNFMPNRKDVRNPRTEYLLQAFQYIVRGEMPMPDGNTYGFISELTPLQQDILAILGVPLHCYTYEYLFDTS